MTPDLLAGALAILVAAAIAVPMVIVNEMHKRRERERLADEARYNAYTRGKPEAEPARRAEIELAVPYAAPSRARPLMPPLKPIDGLGTAGTTATDPNSVHIETPCDGRPSDSVRLRGNES
jgi:hypothetical protein